MTPESTKKIYFIRHGLSELNASGLYAGHSDTPITETGRQQVKATAQKLKDLGIDYIVSSPLSRTMETAKIVAQEIGFPVNKIHTEPLLIERDFGPLEGKPYDPARNVKKYDQLEGVESDEKLIKRAGKLAHKLQAQGCHCMLIIGHGGIGRALRYHLEPDAPFTRQIPFGDFERWQ